MNDGNYGGVDGVVDVLMTVLWKLEQAVRIPLLLVKETTENETKSPHSQTLRNQFHQNLVAAGEYFLDSNANLGAISSKTG